VRILVPNLITSVEEGSEAAVPLALEKLRLPARQVLSASLARTSVDARRGKVRFVSSVAIEVDEAGAARLARIKNPCFTAVPQETMAVSHGTAPLEHRPVVIGFGPGGIFAALLLAREGYRPLVLERGSAIETRAAAVDRFWRTGRLDPACNVQFGEGGAGAFSDGKLTTRIHDPLCRFVLEELAAHGAPADILVRAKPHVGTDRLRGVVRAVREEIVALGGEVRFDTRAERLLTQSGRLAGIAASGSEIAAEAAIAAIGHSARDTFEALAAAGASLVPKAFSVGVRIEHLQSAIDRALYGDFAGHPNLPRGEYQLSYRTPQGRAAYTFCMCPGGQVVAAASEEGGIVTNGMSRYARDGKNANAALAVSVSPEDFGNGWRDGVAFQRKIETAAYVRGGGAYRAPASTVGALLGISASGRAAVEPTYPLGVKETDLAVLFPAQITALLRAALPILGKRLAGFDDPAAFLTAPETRTSSPVRVLRGQDGCAVGVSGLYPCGEGAGYAGGIMSAAVDGLRCALALMRRYAPPKG